MFARIEVLPLFARVLMPVPPAATAAFSISCARASHSSGLGS